MGMSVEDLKHVVLNGFKATFLPFHTKQAWVRRIGKELAQIPNEIQAGDPAAA
jgi:adenosine deaminase